jgi:hypothetical protein
MNAAAAPYQRKSFYRNPGEFLRVCTALALAVATIGCQTAPFTSHSEVSSITRAPAKAKLPGADVFEAELTNRLRLIPEFEEIRKWADAKGVRVWLGGGSATGVASYLREEIEAGAAGQGRFPYTYYDIYRSTQDADIVLDGDERVAIELESFLASRLGYLQGSKRLWEVRLLRTERGQGVGKKDPVIGSDDFRNQNSDSYSTALIEVTTPPKKEARIRDAFDWDNSKDPPFTRDLLTGKITYYRNPKHLSTYRARAGYNPEILSVIRAITKAHQYDGEFSPESLAALKQVIAEFNPNQSVGAEAQRYILGNALKLFQHSRDIEATWNQLEELGLRKKLITFAKSHGDSSLATLLNREPLRSNYPVGHAPWITDASTSHSGKTAREIGLDKTLVSHETNSFLAYENITMSRIGKPNLFISRQNAQGEAAVHGNGAYTRIGRQGGRGTGLTIRFRVHPDAVAGRDFFVVDEYVVFRNANAIVTLPEDRISLPLGEFMSLLDQGKFSGDDLGVMKKLELKMFGEIQTLSDKELDDVFEQVRKSLRAGLKKGSEPASFTYFMKLANTDSRLKNELVADLLANDEFSLQDRYNILKRHNLLSHVFDNAQKTGNLIDSLKLSIMAQMSGDQMDLTKWKQLVVSCRQKYPMETNLWLSNALGQAKDEQLQNLWSPYVAANATELLIKTLLARFGAGSHSKHLFETLNLYLTSLPAVPKELAALAIHDANPQALVWVTTMNSRPGTEFEVFGALSKMKKRSEVWRQEWLKAYLSASKVNPTRAQAMAMSVLQVERAVGEFTFIASALIEGGLGEEAADQAVKKIATAGFFGESEDALRAYYSILRKHIETKPSLDPKYRRWVFSKRNPYRTEMLAKFSLETGAALKAFQKLTAHPQKLSWDTSAINAWKTAFLAAYTESPSAARGDALAFLQRLQADKFSIVADALVKNGLGREVAERAVGKLATAEFMKDVASKSIYFGFLNSYLATLSHLPKDFEKWALHRMNWESKRWATLPRVSSRAGLCMRLLMPGLY